MTDTIGHVAAAGKALVEPAISLLTLDAYRAGSRVVLDVFVLDDASSDGSSEAIEDQFPEVTELHCDGQLYWNRACGAPSPPPSTTTCARIRTRPHQGDRADPQVNQGQERRRTRGEKVIQCSLPSRNHHRRP
jgi:hypothetical protein